MVNARAVESAIRIGLALNCQIAQWCRFARKNYFYPDMPKNFQTSQYDEPICFDGWLDVDVETDEGERPSGSRSSAPTWRRTPARPSTWAAPPVASTAPTTPSSTTTAPGIPLIEIVTKPVPGTGKYAPEVARAYVTALRELLRALGVSDVQDGAGLAALRRQPLAAADAGATRWAPAPRPRTSTRCARSSGRCATR